LPSVAAFIKLKQKNLDLLYPRRTKPHALYE
jgi:hypothetical protein